MPIELLIPVLVFGVLAAIFALLLRRAGAVLTVSRESESFRATVEDLAKRIDATLVDMIARVDALRRQQIEAEAIMEPLDKALETLLAYGEEVRNLGGPPVVAGPKVALGSEIERVDRALQLVEHGAAILASVSSGDRFGEAQTAIKRGYLNILHAREAIARTTAEIAAARRPEQFRWRSRRPGAGET